MYLAHKRLVCPFAIVGVFKNISLNDEENYRSGSGGQWKACISPTDTQTNHLNPSIHGDERDRWFWHYSATALLWSHNMHVWEQKSVIMPQIASIVFQRENIGPSECFGYRCSLRNCPEWCNMSIFWVKTIPPYIEVLFSSKNSYPSLTRRVQRESTAPENIQKDQNFDNEKQLKRPWAIKPTLYTKNLKNRHSADCGWTLTKSSFW